MVAQVGYRPYVRGRRPAPVGGASAAPWTPTQLGSAVVAWWDAADLSSFTFSSGVIISNWTSKTGTNPAAQGTVANQPTYSATARNSLPGVVFDGVNDLFNVTGTGFPTGTASSAVAGVGYSAANGYRSLFFQGGSSASRNVGLNSTGSGNFYVSGGSGNDLNGTNQWGVNDLVFTARFVTGSLGYTVNGAAEVTGTNVINSTPIATVIGRDGTTGFWQGVCQELLVVNRVLTVTERQKLEGYLAWKWALQGLLDASNPYKNAPPTV